MEKTSLFDEIIEVDLSDEMEGKFLEVEDVRTKIQKCLKELIELDSCPIPDMDDGTRWIHLSIEGINKTFEKHFGKLMEEKIIRKQYGKTN